jgi:hypothetical protein
MMSPHVDVVYPYLLLSKPVHDRLPARSITRFRVWFPMITLTIQVVKDKEV